MIFVCTNEDNADDDVVVVDADDGGDDDREGEGQEASREEGRNTRGARYY